MALTKVGPKYQVTIPKGARGAVGLQVGDLVEARVTKEGVILRPKTVIDKMVKPPSSLAALQRQAKRSGAAKLTSKEIQAEIAAVRKAKAKKTV